MIKRFELKALEELIDNDFLHYKITHEQIPIRRHLLKSDADVAEPTKDQISLAELKIFGLHNSLFKNEHDNMNCVYYVDSNLAINRFEVNSLLDEEAIEEVGRIPLSGPRTPGYYPITIQFASKTLAAVADGIDNIHFFAITEIQWNHIHSEKLNHKGIAIKSIRKEKNNLHIVLQYVVLSPLTIAIPALEWLTFNDKWEILRVRKIEVKGEIDYIALEETALGLLIIANAYPRFIEDSKPDFMQLPKPKYFWSQTPELITIKLDPDIIATNDISVTLNGSHIEVRMADIFFLNGELTHEISDNKWCVNKGAFELTLHKNEHVAWDNVIKDDLTGVLTETTVCPSTFRLNQFDELEDCDYSEPKILMRLDGDSRLVTHEANLTSLKHSFTVVIDPKQPPAFCSRHDVHACVWTVPKSNSDTVETLHVGTFNAFGYVLAPTAPRFVVTEPELSYVVSANPMRHLVIYRQPSPICGDLKNRKTGQKITTVAKQHVINLETSHETIGIIGAHTYLIVLTKREIYVLEIN